MPSSINWPVMGGPIAHPTGVTLASDDPPKSLNAPGGTLAALRCWKFKNLASGWAMGGFSGLLL